MEAITYTSFEALIQALDDAQPRDFFKILSESKLTRGDLERYNYWTEAHYGRVCLHRTEEYELVLTCWEPGQASPIHDYEASLAWTHPVCGTLQEERFIELNGGLQRVASTHLTDNDFSFMNESIGIHRYSNPGKDRAVALHLFAKPVTSWNVYDFPGGKKTRIIPEYDQMIQS